MWRRFCSVCWKAKDTGFCREVAGLAFFGGALLLVECGGSPAPVAAPTAPTAPVASATNPAVTAKDIYSIDLGSQTLDVYAANLNGTAFPYCSLCGRCAGGDGRCGGQHLNRDLLGDDGGGCRCFDFLVYSATGSGNAAPASMLVRSKGSTTDTHFNMK